MPRAKHRLHALVEALRRRKLWCQVTKQREIGEPPADRKRTQHAPVIRVVPQYLGGHHPRVAEQRILPPIEFERVALERKKQLLEVARGACVRAAREIARNEFRDVGVAEGDEIRARRIERVEEHRCLAGERPALGAENLPATIRNVAQEAEVEHGIAVRSEFPRQRRLMDLHPREHALETVERLDGMHRRIGHDADRMRARRQRDQPHPVAGAAQVVGGSPAFLRIAQSAPRRIGAPLIKVQARLDARPRRADAVAVGFVQAQLPAQQAGPTGGIDQPARAMGPGLVAVCGVHHVRRAGFDRAHADALHEFDAAAPGFGAEEIFEGAAFELPARSREYAADAELRAAVQLRATVAEEKPEAELAHLRGIEVFAQAERVGEIMRADFHGRFADLVGGGRHRVPTPFQHPDREAGTAVVQLQCEGESGQAAANDQDIHGRRAGHCDHCPGGPLAPASGAAGGASSRRPGSYTCGALSCEAR